MRQIHNYRILHAEEKDLRKCANLLCASYNDNILGENWSEDSAYSICAYFWDLQPDLFFVLNENDVIIGFTFARVYPWYDGPCMKIEEICIEEDYQKKGLGTELLIHTINTARCKYGIRRVQAETFQKQDGMPLSWYKKMGFSTDKKLVCIYKVIETPL